MNKHHMLKMFQKIDNGQYKPIIANDRTLVRLVPIFEALGYSNSYDSNAKTVTFAKDGGTVSYKFTAENYTAETISDGQAESTYELDVPATLQYSDVFYVPLRAFCDMVGLNITWDNATRSVYVENALLTYEQAKEKATEFVNDSDILLGYGRTQRKTSICVCITFKRISGERRLRYYGYYNLRIC